MMDEGADSGDIVSQMKVEISADDSASDLYNKLIKIAKIQITDLTLKFVSNKVIRIKQNNLSSNYWRKRNSKDGEINFNMSSKNIYNLIRALSRPYPGAHFCFKNKLFKVWNSKIINFKMNNFEPGKVIEVNNEKILVKTGDSAILLFNFDVFPQVEVNDYLL